MIPQVLGSKGVRMVFTCGLGWGGSSGNVEVGYGLLWKSEPKQDERGIRIVKSLAMDRRDGLPERIDQIRTYI